MEKVDYQKEATELFDKIKSYSSDELNCPEDLLRLLEIVLRRKRIDLLEETAFHAKFAEGIMKIIQTGSAANDEKYFAKLKSEYASSIEIIKQNLGIVLQDSAGFFREIFEKKYFELSYSGMENLNKLCSDLGCIKLYFNDLKRESD